VFRTVGDQVSLWELLLPQEVLRLPAELARVDVLLDDPVFFAPFAPMPKRRACQVTVSPGFMIPLVTPPIVRSPDLRIEAAWASTDGDR
jgi:hypothetical protein